jgi:sugar lactone lactonase YvrE
VHFCDANKTLYVADTYNHKIKIMKTSDPKGLSTKSTRLESWIGVSDDKNPRVLDGQGMKGLLNEPNGCWANVDSNGKFLGLYIADTGNDCVRFAKPDGALITLELKGIPDVRETASDCVGGTCKADFGFDDSDEEEQKESK